MNNRNSLWIVVGMLVLCRTVSYFCNFENCEWILIRVSGNGASLIRTTEVNRSLKSGSFIDAATSHRNYGRYNLVYNLTKHEKAVLTSPWFAASGPDCSLGFAIAFSGMEPSLTAITQSETKEIRTNWQHLKKSGWSQVRVKVGRVTEPFRIGIEMIGTQDKKTFLALDDVSLSKCSEESKATSEVCSLKMFSCKNSSCISREKVCDIQLDCPEGEDEKDCDNLPLCSRCSFEKDFCCWRNINNRDEFDWIRLKGPTLLVSARPHRDHTTGTGFYIHSNASSALGEAMLESVVFPPPPDETTVGTSPYFSSCQVRFFYHIYASTAGLSLDIVNACDKKRISNRIWSSLSETNGEWKEAVVSITANFSFVLRFCGASYMSYDSDVALDDISLSPECFGLGILSRRWQLNVLIKRWLHQTDPEFLHNEEQLLAMCTRNKSQDTISDVALSEVIGVGVSISVVIGIAIATSILCGIFFHHRKRRRLALRLQMLTTARCRPSGGTCNTETRTELNPTYDFSVLYQDQNMHHLPRKHVDMFRLLGYGAFGEVYEGYLNNIIKGHTKYSVAVKTLPALSSEKAELDFILEARIMHKFNHPNIVKFFGVCFEKHPKLIVLELLEGGDLRNFLRESCPKLCTSNALKMEDLLNLSLDICRGCNYLESRRFIHRDIAARNCLLTCKDSTRVGKIADFGMAREICRSEYYRKDGKALLPVKWMPPEAFVEGLFTTKTDVWSFGILLWEIFSFGYSPYPAQDNQEVMRFVAAGGRLDQPKNCPGAVYEIMKSCWEHFSNNRPFFTEISDKLVQCQQNLSILDTRFLPCYQISILDQQVMSQRTDTAPGQKSKLIYTALGFDHCVDNESSKDLFQEVDSRVAKALKESAQIGKPGNFVSLSDSCISCPLKSTGIKKEHGKFDGKRRTSLPSVTLPHSLAKSYEMLGISVREHRFRKSGSASMVLKKPSVQFKTCLSDICSFKRISACKSFPTCHVLEPLLSELKTKDVDLANK